MKACQWASIRPGISTLPSPEMIFAPGSAETGSVEIVAIKLPRTNTLETGESCDVVPSKIRTFSKSVRPLLSVAGGGASPSTSMSKSCDEADVQTKKIIPIDKAMPVMTFFKTAIIANGLSMIARDRRRLDRPGVSEGGARAWP